MDLMPDMLTVSAKGQITLPVDLRQKYKIESGDKIFGEETETGYLIRRPKKGLLDYEGFIKGVLYDAKTELEMAQAGLSAHVLGEDEC